MRYSLIIGVFLFIVAVMLGLFVLGPVLFNPAFHFHHRNVQYYTDFAHACDSLLTAHPLGTNDFLELPVNDPSLPKIIRDLPPFKIVLQPRHLWILAGGTGHATGYGITWEPQDETHPDTGTLTTYQESARHIVYTTDH